MKSHLFAKKLFTVLLIAGSMFIAAQAEPSRWRWVADNAWDVETATKMGGRKIRFWYVYPYLEEQRNFVVERGIYSRQKATEITYGRSGILANCGDKTYGIFAAYELNSSLTPMGPGATIPLNEVKMQFLEPDTNMEGIVKDVCKYFKL